MEDNLFECGNKRCTRKGTLVLRTDAVDGKSFCVACGKQLKRANWGKLNGDDTPPVRDQMDFPGNGNFSNWGDEARLRAHNYGRSNGNGLNYYGGSRKPLQITPPVQSDTFTCNPDVKGCPLPLKEPVVRIPQVMFDEWVFLAQQLDTEWIAYFMGTEREPFEYDLTECYFPKQTASAATCHAVDGEVREGTLGSVHSHVAMSAFFSGTDEAHFNHQVELVINRRGEVDSRVRIKLECGRFSRVKAKVLLMVPDEKMAKVKLLQEQIVEPPAFVPPVAASAAAGGG
jgi:hypothetical protein